MKYIVDRIENNIVILENLDSKEIVEIDISLLPTGIKEGNVVGYKNNYYIDKDLEKQRRIDIKKKFDRLRNKTINF